MRKIEIIFSRPKRFFVPFSWLIRLYQWSSYSHASISFYSELTKLNMIAEASHGEVHLMEREQWEAQNHIVKAKKYDISEEQFKTFMKYTYKHLQKPYASLQNVGVLFYEAFHVKMFSRGEADFNCSEFVRRAVPWIFPKTKKPIDFIKPKGIYKLIFG